MATASLSRGAQSRQYAEPGVLRRHCVILSRAVQRYLWRVRNGQARNQSERTDGAVRAKEVYVELSDRE